MAAGNDWTPAAYPYRVIEAMPDFAEILQTLPPVDHIQRIDLLDDTGKIIASIENRPGKTGSVRVYAAVTIQNMGYLDCKAAQSALDLFAEHVLHARENPSSHPNIDRLFEVINSDLRYRAVIIKRAD